MNYQLDKGEVLTLIGSEAVQAVLVKSGRIWLTRQDDPRDYCLEAGSRLACRGARMLVIEAIEEASLSVAVAGNHAHAHAHAPAPARLTLALSCHSRG